MKKISICTSILLLFTLFFYSCKKAEASNNNEPVIEKGNFTDVRDGKTYKWVKIGNQTWMSENLAYTGNTIQNLTSNNDWINNTNNDGWCFYDNSINNGHIYGVLYQWEAAKRACPDGWHLPSKEEWITLINYLGGANVAGGKLKESGDAHWQNPNTGANNESGFSALPAGYRLYNDGHFFQLGYLASFWSITETNQNQNAFGYRLEYDTRKITLISSNKLFGFSVRCIKDN